MDELGRGHARRFFRCHTFHSGWLVGIAVAEMAGSVAGHIARSIGRFRNVHSLSFGTAILGDAGRVAAEHCFSFMWQKFGSAPPKKWMLLLATALFALGTFVHGVWYLWVLLLGAFFLAGEFRWAISLGFCWAIGVFIGSALTGHPFEYPLQAFKLALLAVGMHATARTMASELQPFHGDILAVEILGGLLVLRQLAKLNAVPLAKTPAFWLACFGWVLGFKVTRFWADWGWPALMVLIACDLQLLLQTCFAAVSVVQAPRPGLRPGRDDLSCHYK